MYAANAQSPRNGQTSINPDSAGASGKVVIISTSSKKAIADPIHANHFLNAGCLAILMPKKNHAMVIKISNETSRPA